MFRKYSISEDIDIFESPEHNWFNADQSPIQYFEDSQIKNHKKSKAAFSDVEDQLLIREVKTYGRRWKRLSELFPDKTHRMLRNRYFKIINISNESSNCDSFVQLEQCYSLKNENSSNETDIVRKQLKQDIKMRQEYPEMHQLDLIKQQIDLIAQLVSQTKNELISLFTDRMKQ